MAKTHTMYMAGGPVEVPGTIKGIREALPEDQRAQFTAEVENAGFDELREVLTRWSMQVPTENDVAEEAMYRRLQDAAEKVAEMGFDTSTPEGLAAARAEYDRLAFPGKGSAAA